MTIETPHGTVAELQSAIDVALTPPKGPVRVGIPKNFLRMDVPLAEPDETGPPPVREVPTAALADAAAHLANATAPIIVAGGGVRASGASSQLRAVAERLEAPVLVTYKGKGVFPDDHELATGVLCGGTGRAIKNLVADADAVLGVGTDFDAVATSYWEIDLPNELVHVTLESDDIGTNYEPTVGIVADAARTLSALDVALEGSEIASAGGVERVRATRGAIEERIAELDVDGPPLTSVSVLNALRKALPRSAVVTGDAGGVRVWTVVAFDAYDPHGYVNPGSWCSMGTGLPSAIGVKAANPDRDVVAITGDGGLMMCIHELHTLVDERLDVTVVVLNNDDYAIISEEAERTFRMDPGEYGWRENPIDFGSIAAGMGLESRRAESPDEIERTVKSAVESDGPTLVEIPTDPLEPQPSVWMNE